MSRTLACLKLEAYSQPKEYSKHCQRSLIERFVKIPAVLFKPKLEKSKKFLYFLIFQKIKLSGSNIKKFLIFSQKKAILIFQETETPKKFLKFQEMELSYISRTYISGSNFLRKPTIIFWEIKPSGPKLKNLYFWRELVRPENQKFYIFVYSEGIF